MGKRKKRDCMKCGKQFCAYFTNSWPKRFWCEECRPPVNEQYESRICLLCGKTSCKLLPIYHICKKCVNIAYIQGHRGSVDQWGLYVRRFHQWDSDPTLFGPRHQLRYVETDDWIRRTPPPLELPLLRRDLFYRPDA